MDPAINKKHVGSILSDYFNKVNAHNALMNYGFGGEPFLVACETADGRIEFDSVKIRLIGKPRRKTIDEMTLNKEEVTFLKGKGCIKAKTNGYKSEVSLSKDQALDLGLVVKSSPKYYHAYGTVMGCGE